MHKKSTLERPDREFLSLADTICSQCIEHAEEWNINPEYLSSLNTLVARANTAYEANSDKATRNLITSTGKKTAFSELKRFLSLFVDYLRSNLSIPDEALAIMSLRPRIRRASQPKPRPEEIPLLSVVKRHDEMTVYVNRTEHGRPTQSIANENYGGFKLRWRFEDETTYHFEISTRLRRTLFFGRENETRRVILSAAWVNPRMEEGPWSEDITEVIG